MEVFDALWVGLGKCLELLTGLEEIERVDFGGIVGKAYGRKSKTNSSVCAGDGDDFALERDLPVEILLGLGCEIYWVGNRLLDLSSVSVGVAILWCDLSLVGNDGSRRHLEKTFEMRKIGK